MRGTGVERGELVEQEMNRGAVADDVVHDDQQDVSVGGDLDQSRPNQRATAKLNGSCEHSSTRLRAVLSASAVGSVVRSVVGSGRSSSASMCW